MTGSDVKREYGPEREGERKKSRRGHRPSKGNSRSEMAEAVWGEPLNTDLDQLFSKTPVDAGRHF